MKKERWEKLTKREQLLNIGAELMRAKVWQGKNQEKFLSAIERALQLIDLSLSDERWKNNLLMILRLREELAKFYTSKRTDDISILYRAL